MSDRRQTSRFDGKVAVVTGGGRGLGQASAIELAARGARVAVLDRKKSAAEETAALCQKEGPEAKAFAMDQADPASVGEAIGAAKAAFGRMDLLFANAGTGKFSPLIDMTPEEWDMVLRVNLNGTFYVCREVGRHMAKQGMGGKMVLTASSGALVIADQLGAYCVSKAGVVMLMKQLASELGTYRINVNAIMPGVVETGMTTPMLEQENWQRMLRRETPVGRWGQPEDVAKLVAFLLSDDAAYINGDAVMIDGGSTLHGYPRWYALDYSQDGPPDWEARFADYPYGAP